MTLSDFKHFIRLNNYREYRIFQTGMFYNFQFYKLRPKIIRYLPGNNL